MFFAGLASGSTILILADVGNDRVAEKKQKSSTTPSFGGGGGSLVQPITHRFAISISQITRTYRYNLSENFTGTKTHRFDLHSTISVTHHMFS